MEDRGILLVMDIAFDRYSMIINGERIFIRSGAMHYFRLPSQALWADRLFKLKAAGYNTVDLYFCWAYHSSAQGVYDFSGFRDIRELLRLTQALGLMVIARPGPYINAEYSGGGFPGWLLAKRHLPLRNRREGAYEWSDEYMGYVREWWSQIIPILNEAPNILMVQIENEYATLEVEPDYMQALYDMTREMGVKVPLFHNDLYVAGLYEDIVDIYSFDNYSVTQFETDWREMPEVFQVLDNVENSLRPFCQNRPLMAAELQAGWFGTWKGYKYEKIIELLGREHINISTKSLLGQGLTIFNHYKAIGGTNWDYTGSIETYTSYDFGAPISEAGINTERLFEAKAINYFIQSFNLSVTDRCETFPLTLSHPEYLYASRSVPDVLDARWLFLRNLTYESKNIHVGGDYSVTIKPFEVLILPYRIPLKNGYELIFSTVEPLYQTERLLVLKANRPLTASLKSAGFTNASFSLPEGDDDITLISTADDVLTFHCPELPDSELRHLKTGELTIILLGQKLVDTFWLEESGAICIGPEMRLPNQTYALVQGNRTLFNIPPQSSQIKKFDAVPFSDAKAIEIPALKHWEIYNNAPELSADMDARLDLKSGFVPVSREGMDFDVNGIYEGSAWYEVLLEGACPQQVEIDARHIWAIFLNGRLIGRGHQLVVIYGMDHPSPTKIVVPEEVWKPGEQNRLLVFVNGLGHPKGFHDDGQVPQGLLRLIIDGQNPTSPVRVRKEVYSQCSGFTEEALATLAQFQSAPIVLMRTSFVLPYLPQTVIPWGLKLQDVDFERIDIYLNGLLVGRYWQDCRRQEIFYLPEGLLNLEKDARNTLALVLMNFEPFIDQSRLKIHPQQFTLCPYEVFTKALQNPETLID